VLVVIAPLVFSGSEILEAAVVTAHELSNTRAKAANELVLVLEEETPVVDRVAEISRIEVGLGLAVVR